MHAFEFTVRVCQLSAVDLNLLLVEDAVYVNTVIIIHICVVYNVVGLVWKYVERVL